MTPTRPFHQSPEGCEVSGVEREAVPIPGGEVGVQLLRTRALPGARLARVPRFGRGLGPDQLAAATEGLASLASGGRVVRLTVEVYAEEPEQHRAVERALEQGGFTPSPSLRSYLHTLWMDLAPTEDELLMSLHRSARRNVRLPARKGHVVEPLSTATSVARLDELYREAFESTGAEVPEVDWGRWLELMERRPDLVHMVGIRREEDEALLGFAVAISHGDVAEYHHAASTRDRESGVPLLYAPLWELVVWAKARGARWFDFGGVTLADAEEDDPLEGISDFKRFFCRNVARVGGEWTLDPPSLTGRAWKTVQWLKGAASGG